MIYLNLPKLKKSSILPTRQRPANICLYVKNVFEVFCSYGKRKTDPL